MIVINPNKEELDNMKAVMKEKKAKAKAEKVIKQQIIGRVCVCERERERERGDRSISL